ncbi:HupE/UreJ family protein [Azospirillum argentinense]|uniref:Urease accessory protein n=1 Tax=Azospirillum brasilense TaxID=192 RepID=A0A4D8QHG7_AZOBR|nr:HupE/UreJ family protein [Azospirillum argentinense]QCO05202.1 urease accessory protein [Azospirillum argentinense]
MNRLLSAGTAGLLAATLALPAAAHTGHAGDAMFVQGLLHPLTGIDHLLTMLAVGVWAAQNGGRAIWLLPTAFIAMLSGGAVLGMAGIEFPAVEAGIAASVAVLGLLVLLNKRVPAAAAAVLVGAFAVLHGHAHGTEMPQTADPFLYGLGFVLSTAMLHGTGIAIGLARHMPRRLFATRALRRPESRAQ